MPDDDTTANQHEGVNPAPATVAGSEEAIADDTIESAVQEDAAVQDVSEQAIAAEPLESAVHEDDAPARDFIEQATAEDTVETVMHEAIAADEIIEETIANAKEALREISDDEPMPLEQIPLDDLINLPSEANLEQLVADQQPEPVKKALTAAELEAQLDAEIAALAAEAKAEEFAEADITHMPVDDIDFEQLAATEAMQEELATEAMLDAEISAMAAQAKGEDARDFELSELPDSLEIEAKRPELEKAYALDPLAKYAAVLNGPPQETGGIEILIQMAAKGEIDPKNIDIIDVTDRFLRAISAVPKENLRQSGKIIFQASVLLRMKAEALLAAKVEDELGFGDDYVDFDIDGSPLIYDSNHQIIGRQITLADLERALVRQTKLRQMRHRRVTLEQLIEALREAERLEATRGERKLKARIVVDGYGEMRDMDDILDLAHDEDIEDVIARIEGLLVHLLETNKLLPLIAIIEALGGRGDWVDAFLAVLFLSNAGKITLEQQEFYGTLFIAPASVDAGAIVPPTVQNSSPPTHH